MHVVCRRAEHEQDVAVCLQIRDTVFVGEQKVPVELERDGLDDSCIHYLASIDKVDVGTARVMIMEDKFKFQRVAVLSSARGAGVGAVLMKYIIEDLAKRDDAAGRQYFLSSQVDAIPFYERLGFSICSEDYWDAGILHRDMAREI